MGGGGLDTGEGSSSEAHAATCTTGQGPSQASGLHAGPRLCSVEAGPSRPSPPGGERGSPGPPGPAGQQVRRPGKHGGHGPHAVHVSGPMLLQGADLVSGNPEAGPTRARGHEERAVREIVTEKGRVSQMSGRTIFKENTAL